MHSRDNWDHLRYVLAVAEAGSISQAARNLGVNHATVLRHVAAFEQISQTEIFQKSASGYAVLDERIRVIDAAREVETAVHAVQQILAGVRAPVQGLVRVTSTDSFCQVILPPMIGKWRSGQRIELLSSSSRLDLTRMRADVAVRPARGLEDDMRGTVAAELRFDVYGPAGSGAQGWLALSGSLERSAAAQWMAQNVAPSDVAGSGNSFLVLRELVANGLGQAILPCIIADGDSRLTRRAGILPEIYADIWVASHVDLFDVARIKAVHELLISAMAENADRLAGRA